MQEPAHRRSAPPRPALREQPEPEPEQALLGLMQGIE